MAGQSNLLSTSREERDEVNQELLEFDLDRRHFQLVLTNLVKNSSRLSTLEILLLLHYCLDNSSMECECYMKNLLLPCNLNYLKNKFTLMKEILEFILISNSEKLINYMNSDSKTDYQMHLFHLLRVSLTDIHQAVVSFVVSEDSVDKAVYEILTTLQQIIKYVEILFSRHCWFYGKKWRHYSERFRPGQSVLLPIRFQVFSYYEAGASIGRFPCILWQETSLIKKIKLHDSLDVIFCNGNEEKYCICFNDGEEYKEDFAIFLNCDHIVCASCTQRLLVGDTKCRVCPICRTAIKCWTTKKLVQLTLNEEKQQEDGSLNKQRQQENSSLVEQRQRKEGSLDEQYEQKQEVEVSGTPPADVHRSSSREIFYELCRFDSSINFLNCLKCLCYSMTELSFLEILLILRSNLVIGRCSSLKAAFIEKFQVCHLISGLQLIKYMIMCLLRMIQIGRLQIHSEGLSDSAIRLRCLSEIEEFAGKIVRTTAQVYPHCSIEILQLGSVINKILGEIEKIFFQSWNEALTLVDDSGSSTSRLSDPSS